MYDSEVWKTPANHCYQHTDDIDLYWYNHCNHHFLFHLGNCFITLFSRKKIQNLSLQHNDPSNFILFWHWKSSSSWLKVKFLTDISLIALTIMVI